MNLEKSIFRLLPNDFEFFHFQSGSAPMRGFNEFLMEGLILAQDERWRRA